MVADVAELTIPKSRGEIGFLAAIGAICVVFVVLALIDLSRGDAVIASCLWLAFMAFCVWNGVRDAGGLRNMLTDMAGSVAGRLFAETDAAAGEVRFGYELWGRRHIRHRVTLESIESVDWSTGQASCMAGRDENDWTIRLWYRHGDPAKSAEREKLKWYPRPDQDLHAFGPPRRRSETEALGLAFVGMLRDAGVPLVAGEESAAETCFVRG